MVGMIRKWKELPPELLEIVLACLPQHVLCRCRLVCKTWNHLITRPQFVSLRRAYAHVPSRQGSSVLITPRFRKISVPRGTSLTMLDIEDKRIYALSDRSCIADIINYSCDTSFSRYGWYQLILAADKDLVYIMCESRVCQPERKPLEQHIICNPMTKDFQLIPEPTILINYYHAIIVVMAVDNATQSYRIVLINAHYGGELERQVVQLYDSTSTEWRILCEAPAWDYHACSSIFLNGVFYTLFVGIPWNFGHKLFSCDLETGAWSEIDVAFTGQLLSYHPQDRYQLVVTLGRLFLMRYTGPPVLKIQWGEIVKRKYQIKVSIWEIELGAQGVRKVAEMARLEKYPSIGELVERDFRSWGGNLVIAVGCGNSIVISTWTGHSLRYDLLRKRWCELPFADFEHLYPGNWIKPGIVASLIDF